MSTAPAGPSRTDALLRRGFRHFNRFMVLLWRLGLHRWGMSNPYAGFIMVLTHTGRRSGLPRRTPLNFAVADGDLYCVAGFGAGADWYRNLVANPGVQVWLPDGAWWAGEATDVTDTLPDAERVDLVRHVLIASGFAAYLAGLNPRTMDDAAVAAATASYRLVRIRPTTALTGPGGPGDLAWVWPPAGGALAVAWAIWRSRRRRGGGRRP